MKRLTQIVLLIGMFCLNSYGQGSWSCDNSKQGIKTVTSVTEKGSSFIPDKEIELYNRKGKLTKNEAYQDSLLTRVDTFIYSSDNKLLWRKTIDPITRRVTQSTKFLYDSLGLNYRAIVSSFSPIRIDSATIDTNYLHIRYDFIRNNNNLFTERKRYSSTSKIAEFDTSKFDITYQSWKADSVIFIEDYYAGKVEYIKKYYEDCRLIRTEFLDENDNVKTVYEYEYKKFDSRGNWLIQEIYKTEEGETELVGKYSQIIELY